MKNSNTNRGIVASPTRSCSDLAGPFSAERVEARDPEALPCRTTNLAPTGLVLKCLRSIAAAVNADYLHSKHEEDMKFSSFLIVVRRCWVGCLSVDGQARSLGSLAADMKVASNRRRLDVFTLDLLEEWTALHGSLVWRQVSASFASTASS